MNPADALLKRLRFVNPALISDTPQDRGGHCSVCGSLGLQDFLADSEASLYSSILSTSALGYPGVFLPVGDTSPERIAKLRQAIETQGLIAVAGLCARCDLNRPLPEVSFLDLHFTTLTSLLSWPKPVLESELTRLTLVPEHPQGTLQTLERIPPAWHSRLHFCFPIGVPGLEMQDREIHGLLQEVRARFPSILPTAPWGREVPDRRNPQSLEWDFDTPPAWETRSPRPAVDFSVIIPTYNRREILPQVLAHLAAQTISADFFEILIVDDGSSDGTEPLIRSMSPCLLSGLNTRFFLLPRNTHLTDDRMQNRAGPARNLGALHASGSWLLFLDADILLSPDFLERLRSERAHADVLQPVRADLSGPEESPCPSRPFDRLPPKPQESADAPWRHASTYCFAVSRRHFFSCGRFLKNYFHYGFEDVDLAYRLHRLGCRFRRMEAIVHHAPRSLGFSEYGTSALQRDRLLTESSSTFFRQTLDPRAFHIARDIRNRSIAMPLLEQEALHLLDDWTATQILEQLGDRLHRILLFGDRAGVLALKLFRAGAGRIGNIRSFHPDLEEALLADALNKPQVAQDWRYKASHACLGVNATGELLYETETFDGRRVEASINATTWVFLDSAPYRKARDARWIRPGAAIVLRSGDRAELEAHDCPGLLHQRSFEGGPETSFMQILEFR